MDRIPMDVLFPTPRVKGLFPELRLHKGISDKDREKQLTTFNGWCLMVRNTVSANYLPNIRFPLIKVVTAILSNQRDETCMTLSSIKPETVASLEDFFQRAARLICGAAVAGIAMSLFKKCAQFDNEDVLTFLNRVQQLFQQAYPTTDQQRNSQGELCAQTKTNLYDKGLIHKVIEDPNVMTNPTDFGVLRDSIQKWAGVREQIRWMLKSKIPIREASGTVGNGKTNGGNSNGKSNGGSSGQAAANSEQAPTPMDIGGVQKNRGKPNRGRGKPRGGQNRRGRNVATVEANYTQRPQGASQGACFNCGQTGHWKNECPKRQSGQGGGNPGRGGFSGRGRGRGGRPSGQVRTMETDTAEVGAEPDYDDEEDWETEASLCLNSSPNTCFGI